jgi:AraC-like DNA-binding protein
MVQSPKPLNPSRAEVACYAADMLASLRRLSEASGMTLLAHLVDLACAEAVRNAHAGDAAVGDAAETRGPKRAPDSRGN